MPGLFDDLNPFSNVATNQYGLSDSTITRGTLVSFHYPRSMSLRPNMIHDPRPMVIITDVWPSYVRGVNLHYLTFPYIKNLLQTYGNSGLTYSNIRPDRYLAQAFRMYSRAGMQQPKKLDTQFLLTVLGSVRSFAPGELEKIKQSIQTQIKSRLQIKANELQSYEDWRAQLAANRQQQLDTTVNQVQNQMVGAFQPQIQPTGVQPQQAPQQNQMVAPQVPQPLVPQPQQPPPLQPNQGM